MNPPGACRGRQAPLLDPDLRGRHEVCVNEVQEDPEGHAGIPSFARTKRRQRHGDECEHQHHQGQRNPALEFGDVHERRRAQQLAARLALRNRPAGARIRHHDRDPVLGEADAAEARLARHPLDALAVVQHDDLGTAPGLHSLLRPGGGRDLDPLAGVVLDEDVDEAAVRAALLRVEDRLAVRKGPECARLELAELRIAHAAAAQRLGPVAGFRPDHESEPGQPDRDRQGERIHRQVQALRADAAGPDSRHLAFVIEPAEREHGREQHADRHQHHQVLERREADQSKDDVVRKSPIGRDAEDPGQLIAHQDREQDDRDAPRATSRLHAGHSGR